ncbi:MAG TPA: hypothetical protein PK653_09345 [Syntrophales bacterium]|nr:hypothetical protein [Syntrophales bacterium]
MSIITKEIRILLAILFMATILAWLFCGPEILKYIGGPILAPVLK